MLEMAGGGDDTGAAPIKNMKLWCVWVMNYASNMKGGQEEVLALI